MQDHATIGSPSGAAQLKLAVDDVQPAVTGRSVRYLASRALVGIMRIFGRTDERRSHYKTSLAGHLRKAGYIELGKLLTRAQCDEIHRYLHDRDLIAACETDKVFRFDAVPADVQLADYTADTVWNCPHVLDVANRREIINIMASYLGYTPAIAHIGLRWSFPTGALAGLVHNFHRDIAPDSTRLLIYLSDVDNTAGPHAYVEGTHRERMPWRPHSYSNDDISRRYGGGVFIRGPAGTAFAIDPNGIHKGVAPTRQPCLLLVIHYALPLSKT